MPVAPRTGRDAAGDKEGTSRWSLEHAHDPYPTLPYPAPSLVQYGGMNGTVAQAHLRKFCCFVLVCPWVSQGDGHWAPYLLDATKCPGFGGGRGSGAERSAGALQRQHDLPQKKHLIIGLINDHCLINNHAVSWLAPPSPSCGLQTLNSNFL